VSGERKIPKRGGKEGRREVIAVKVYSAEKGGEGQIYEMGMGIDGDGWVVSLAGLVNGCRVGLFVSA